MTTARCLICGPLEDAGDDIAMHLHSLSHRTMVALNRELDATVFIPPSYHPSMYRPPEDKT